MRMTREQRAEKLKRELANLKTELRKTRGQFKRSVIQSEIQSVCRELSRLQD